MKNYPRRTNQFLSESEAHEILEKGQYGVLALRTEDGTYATPTNFVLVGNEIYFHCSPKGDKPEAVRRTPKGSLCVVEKSRTVPQLFATDYRSAIAFGPLNFVTDLKEKEKALYALAEKYSPLETQDKKDKEVHGSLEYVCMFKMQIEELSAKMAIDYVRAAP